MWNTNNYSSKNVELLYLEVVQLFVFVDMKFENKSA